MHAELRFPLYPLAQMRTGPVLGRESQEAGEKVYGSMVSSRSPPGTLLIPWGCVQGSISISWLPRVTLIPAVPTDHYAWVLGNLLPGQAWVRHHPCPATSRHPWRPGRRPPLALPGPLMTLVEQNR